MDNIPSYDDLSQMSDQQLTQIFGVRDFFVYELDFSTFAANATPQGSFTVQADSNFLWQYGSMYWDGSADVAVDSPQSVPMVSCNVQDSSSGRNLMSANVPVQSIFGNGQLPFLLPTPRFFRAQTTVTVSLLNFSSALSYRMKLSFIGTKFYKYAQGI